MEERDRTSRRLTLSNVRARARKGGFFGWKKLNQAGKSRMAVLFGYLSSSAGSGCQLMPFL